MLIASRRLSCEGKMIVSWQSGLKLVGWQVEQIGGTSGRSGIRSRLDIKTKTNGIDCVTGKNYVKRRNWEVANASKQGGSLLQIDVPNRRKLRKLPGRALNLSVRRLQGVAKTPSTMH